MTKPVRSIIAVLLVLIANFCYAQKPVITYNTPQIYNYQIPIIPLTPSNTGGTIPVSTPVTLGSGFSNLTSVAVDATGNVYFTANGSNAVEKIPAGGGSAVILGYGFTTPTGVAVDAAGNVYVA